MKLIISFSGRKGGNCDQIAEHIASSEDRVVYFRDVDAHRCGDCQYECFVDYCKYHEDEVFSIFESMLTFDKVILVVPMYCGNPASLYFVFNERCQDFFMHHGDKYEDIISRLFVIGIYGSKEDTPDFIPCFEKWFNQSPYSGHVLGIERHKYEQKMGDFVLDVEEVRKTIDEFVEK